MIFRRVLRSDYVLLALLALPAAFPFLLNAGLPNTADGVLHLYRTFELDRAWHEGVFYPRLAPDFAFGYGYPIFNYYAPLFYFLAQALHLLSGNLEVGMKAAIVLVLYLYPLGTYMLARDWLPRASALVAAVAYLYVPYRFYESFIQGDYPQLLALALVPFCLWAVGPAPSPFQGEGDRSLWGMSGGKASTHTPHPHRFFAFVLAYAALVLSHNITALISTPLIGAYMLLVLFHERRRFAARTLRLAFALALSLGLSALFWLPALGEQRYVHIEKLTLGFFDFHRFFISPGELLAPNSPPDLAAVNPYIPFNLGPGIVALAVAGLLLTLVRRARGKPAAPMAPLFFLAWALALAALTLPISTLLWERLPMLVLVEFPWRFVGVAAVPLALLAGLGANELQSVAAHFDPRRWTAVIPTLVLALVILDSFVFLFPRTPFIVHGNPSLADIARFEVESGALGTTSASEYLPLWTQRRMYDSPLVPALLDNRTPDPLQREALPVSVHVETLAQSTTRDVYRFTSEARAGALMVHLRRIYFPGWGATIDGQPAPLDLLAPNGTMRVQAPAGEHVVAFTFGETNIRLAADVISLVSAAAVAGLAVWYALTRGATEDKVLSSVAPRSAPALTALVLIAFYFLAPRLGFVRASTLPAIAGVEHARADNFGGELQLLGYDLSAAQVRAGQALALTLDWQPLRLIQKDYATFVHLDNPLTLETVAEDVNAHPGNISTVELPLSLYVRDPHVLAVPEMTEPGVYWLRVGVMDAHADQALPVAQADGSRRTRATLQAVRVYRSQPVDLGGITRAQVRFGQVELIGYTLDARNVLSTYWRATQTPNADATLFVHLLDEQGQIRATFDGPPTQGLLPLSAWDKDEVVIDRRALAPGANGDGRIALGLYDPATLQRYAAQGADGTRLPDDQFVLPAATR